ncbi:B12-binding domain-containing radical SAM protein [Anaerotalea alkaliphila]|uniref:Radical SAM protein n=1 Tax=Anaerotalea alkaliphila TaxID=2662126 RepID=A0A7X5KP54_9FIRM|nr:radical SAM protein [Anaerotalea alkaliphila]NDL68568.1 radical SAM protein [Anaerotalea alkaliphila]
MKIAFLAPAGAMHRHGGSFGRSLHYAPLTLTTLAALVPEELCRGLAIYDETAGSIPLDLEADLVCITCITGTAPRCYAYADHFRRQGKTVVLGGVHPTLMPEEAALHADAVVTGFAEESFPRLLRDYAAGRLGRLYSQQPGYTIAGRPVPRRDLLDKRRYITMNTVEAVRGCSLPCSFCAYPAAFGRTLYKRPVREVAAEIEALPGREVLFPDVNLIADRAYALELFRELAPLKKSWFGLVTSAVGIDRELVETFEKSGCRGLLVGFESVHQSSQKDLHKGVNQVEDYGELMKVLHGAGILVQGCFAFGSDEEDASVFERTVEMAVRTKIDLPRYSILTPFPKTELHARLEAQGRILKRDWALYDVEHCVFAPARMTPEELEAGTEWAWRETYRTANIWKRLSPFRLSPHIAWPVNLGYKGYADKFVRFTPEVMTDNSDIKDNRDNKDNKDNKEVAP